MFNFFKKNKTNIDQSASDEILKTNFYRAINMIKNRDKNGYEILEMTAEDGYSDAQYLYAQMLEEGSDQPQLSFQWYKRAAEQGHPEAQRCLADLYMAGNFTEKNERIALEWYKKSANGGVAEAQFVLGEFYRSGSFVQRDLKIAEEWYMKSSQQGYEPANERLRQIRSSSEPKSETKNSSKRSLDPSPQEFASKMFQIFAQYCIENLWLEDNFPDMPKIITEYMSDRLDITKVMDWVNSVPLRALKNKNLVILSNGNAQKFYLLASSLCFAYGSNMAYKWYHDYDKFLCTNYEVHGLEEDYEKALDNAKLFAHYKNGKVIQNEELINTIEDLLEILTQNVERLGNINDELYRHYIFAGMQAFFLLGIHVNLNSFGKPRGIQ